MKIDPQFLTLQLEYSRWASERSLEAARPLSTDELTRDLSNSFGGVLGTLTHVFAADRIWVSRLQGAPRMTLVDPGEHWTLDELRAAWAETASQWLDWVRGVEDFETELQYTNLAGQRHSIPLWQVVMHVVNHGTYHRGQVTTMLKQLGYSPIATDLHVFYLSRR